VWWRVEGEETDLCGCIWMKILVDTMGYDGIRQRFIATVTGSKIYAFSMLVDCFLSLLLCNEAEPSPYVTHMHDSDFSSPRRLFLHFLLLSALRSCLFCAPFPKVPFSSLILSVGASPSSTLFGTNSSFPFLLCFLRQSTPSSWQ
jgi:hypothetical protein